MAVRAMARLSRTATNSSRTAHVEFTSSLRHVHELVRVAAWPYLPTDTVMCTSRIDGTSSSRLVYALHEQFAHGTSSSRRVHEQFANSSRAVHDYCLLVNHSLTHTCLCVFLQGGVAFSCTSASFSLFCCSSTTARAAARYWHLLFSAMIVSLAFSMLSLPQPIQNDQRLGRPPFYMACPSRHDTVRIAQTRRANAGSA